MEGNVSSLCRRTTRGRAAATAASELGGVRRRAPLPPVAAFPPNPGVIFPLPIDVFLLIYLSICIYISHEKKNQDMLFENVRLHPCTRKQIKYLELGAVKSSFE